ncbi:hypothetical protein MP228_000033 [Amoeboaphelidium protococcarum]|nr:hypothetical protein MP228_000033 [Amoeboaphelidium protococcarum]
MRIIEYKTNTADNRHQWQRNSTSSRPSTPAKIPNTSHLVGGNNNNNAPHIPPSPVDSVKLYQTARFTDSQVSNGLAKSELLHGRELITRHFQSQQVLLAQSKRDRDSKAISLYFEFKACIASICSFGEQAQLSFSLYNHAERRFISEEYIIHLTPNGMPADEEKIGQLKTIFVDLSKKEASAGAQVYLVCKILRIGMMNTPEEKANSDSSTAGNKYNQSFKRPFGYAVLNIQDLLVETHSDGAQHDSFLSQQGLNVFTDAPEYQMKIFTPTAEDRFPDLYDSIIQSNNNGYEKCYRAELICVSLKVISGKCPLDPAVPLTHRQGFPEIIYPNDERNSLYLTLVSGDFAQGRKSSAKNVQIEVEVRNGAGVSLPMTIYAGSGELRQSMYKSVIYYHSNAPSYLECIRFDVPVECIDRGTHLFFTFSHCSSSDKFSSFSGGNGKGGGIGEQSDKIFAFTALPLMVANVDTMLADGQHSLKVFKYDQKLCSPDIYLEALSALRGSSDTDSKSIRGSSPSVGSVAPLSQLQSKLQVTKDRFICKTQLCSTRLTQDVSLLKLIRFSELPQSDMSVTLKNFTFIGPMEITKYLRQILDQLFAIMTMPKFKHDKLVQQLAFFALVFVINIVSSDKRFINFRPILDAYLDSHFEEVDNVGDICSIILSQMTDLTRNAKDPMLAKELRSALKAWEYLFRFVSVSYSKQPQQIGSLQVQLDRFFDFILMNIVQPGNSGSNQLSGLKQQSSENVALIGTWTFLLQNLPTALNVLKDIAIFQSGDILLSYFIRLIDAFSVKRKKIEECKMEAVRSALRIGLFESQDSTMHKFSVCTLKFCIAQTNSKVDEQLRSLSLQTQAELMSRLVDEELQLDLEPLSADLRCLFEALLQQLGECALDSVLIPQLQLNIFQVASMLQDQDLLQLFISISYNQVVSLLAVIDSAFILEKPLRDCVDPIVYRILFCLYETASSSKVKVDVFSKVSLCLQEFECDSSSRFISLLCTIWQGIQKECSLKLVLKSLIPLTPLRELPEHRRIVQIIADIVVLGRHQDGSAAQRGQVVLDVKSIDYSEVDIEIIQLLDILISCEDTIKSKALFDFCKVLGELLPSEYLKIAHNIQNFITMALSAQKYAVDTMHGLCQSVVDDSSSNTPSMNDDAAVELLLEMMKFMSVLKRDKLFIKYTHSLVDIHLKNKHYTEAAYVLRQHAELYEWNPEISVDALDAQVSTELLEQSLSYFESTWPELGLSFASLPQLNQLRSKSSAFQCRELLSIVVIKLFILDQQFEIASEVADTLLYQYRTVIFDFQKASYMYQLLAQLSQQIDSKERYYPSYFRVAFYGQGWQSGDCDALKSLNGSQFIYSSEPFQKLGDFIDVITDKYPGAQIDSSNQFVMTEDMLNRDGRFVQIGSLNNVPNQDLHRDVLTTKFPDLVPQSAKDWASHNGVNTFTLTRPLKKVKGGHSADNEFLNLWTEVFTFKVNGQFPSCVKRLKVVNVDRQEVSPIQTALQNVIKKSSELMAFEKQFSSLISSRADTSDQSAQDKRSSATKGQRKSTELNVNCNSFTMSLNGAVDAPVNGGIKMYREAFLGDEYLVQNPDHRGLIQQLKDAILEHTAVIDRCLKLHGIIVPKDLMPLHENLLILFTKNFADEIDELKLEI